MVQKVLDAQTVETHRSVSEKEIAEIFTQMNSKYTYGMSIVFGGWRHLVGVCNQKDLKHVLEIYRDTVETEIVKIEEITLYSLVGGVTLIEDPEPHLSEE